MGFWEGPILEGIIALGGLDTRPKAGSGCCPIPLKKKEEQETAVSISYRNFMVSSKGRGDRKSHTMPPALSSCFSLRRQLGEWAYRWPQTFQPTEELLLRGGFCVRGTPPHATGITLSLCPQMAGEYLKWNLPKRHLAPHSHHVPGISPRLDLKG